jgi:hypothetical protein
VLIETKLATCTAADRYSGDYEKVKNYLEEKLVKTKGVKQLLLLSHNIDDIDQWLR